MSNMQSKKSLLLINGNSLTTSQLVSISIKNSTIQVVDPVLEKIEKSHQLLTKMVHEKRIIYGVNTGMGGFVNWLIPPGNERLLQENLISGVATNVGSYFEEEIVRGSMLARLNSLARGNSGISKKNFLILLEMFNKNIIPCVPSKGSLGASGDLGPLAAIALVATGKWKAKYKGKIVPSIQALKKAGITPMSLGYKEGLALINGTSTMASLASFNVERFASLLNFYEKVSCLSFEGLKANISSLDPRVHQEKPHKGQFSIAENLWNILKPSKMIAQNHDTERQLKSEFSPHPRKATSSIEDAYSIRCTPQIIGPIRDTIDWVRNIINNELNSSNDNPLIIPEANEVFHNGHFHGQYLSMAMDYLSISLTVLSNLSDRRIDRFMDQNNSNGLSPFLSGDNQGLSLGLMGGQFMSTSLTAENRSLCTPLSIQTLTSTGDFQDIISMGLTAARRCNSILNNLYYIIAFELICGMTAIRERGIESATENSQKLIQEIEAYIPDFQILEFTEKLEKAVDFIKKVSDLYRTN